MNQRRIFSSSRTTSRSGACCATISRAKAFASMSATAAQRSTASAPCSASRISWCSTSCCRAEDGLSICRRLRAGSRVPILMLTAKSEEHTTASWASKWARTTICQSQHSTRASWWPAFAPSCAAPRRPADSKAAAFLINATLSVDLDKRQVAHADGSELSLTSAEFDLLGCFLARPNRVLSREQLMDWTRDGRPIPLDRTIDVQVSRLRKRSSANGELIKTVRSAGYVFTGSVKEPEMLGRLGFLSRFGFAGRLMAIVLFALIALWPGSASAGCSSVLIARGDHRQVFPLPEQVVGHRRADRNRHAPRNSPPC